MDGQTQRPNTFASTLSFCAMARSLRRDKKSRTTLVRMAHHFEDLAKAAETETLSSSASDNCKQNKEALPLIRSRTRGDVTV